MHSPHRFLFFLFVFSGSRPMLGVGCCDPRPFPVLPLELPFPRTWPDGGGVKRSLVTLDGDLKAWSVDEMAATYQKWRQFFINWDPAK
jgi:hypothetical protein